MFDHPHHPLASHAQVQQMLNASPSVAPYEIFGMCRLCEKVGGLAQHISLGGWRSSVGMHISSGTAAGAVREGRFPQAQLIGIVHAHFVGRSKIDLTSISDPKMFGMCRIQSDQEICCICRVLFLPFCSLFLDMKPTMLLFCHIFCNMKAILLRICPSFCYMKPIVLPFCYLF